MAHRESVVRADRIPAAIVDVDDTLVDARGRRIAQGIEFASRQYRAGRTIVVVTAREARLYRQTTRWLAMNLPVPFVGPFHRRNGDTRPFAVVKAEIYQLLSQRFDIRAAIDDNPDVLAAWRRLGIPEVEAVPARQPS
ncbi:hypothetical protein A5686_06075 [Mycobacterium sp. E2479]|nr:hypothetical protein A5686_06075 [Mycobacterium sp. E2479]